MIRILSLFCLVLFIASACKTVEPELVESFVMTPEKSEKINSSVEIPKVELFVSAPFIEPQISEPVINPDIQIPQEDVPEVLQQVVSKEPVEVITAEESEIKYKEPIEEPLKDILIEKSESDITVEKEKAEKLAAGTTINEIIIPPVVIEEKSDVSPERITAYPDEDLLIDLESEGWIYSGESSVEGIELRNRQFADGHTLFLFSFSRDGEFELTFNLQNLNSGEEEDISYVITIEEDEDEKLSPIIIEAFEGEYIKEDQSEVSMEISTALEDENIPEIIASLDQFFSNGDSVDYQLSSDLFNLLEDQGGYNQYLVDLAENVFRYYPYDNLSAEMLYKAAQVLEQPGPKQNIEKALQMFKLVRDQFPISIYCDKSEERIRYLERHFRKIY